MSKKAIAILGLVILCIALLYIVHVYTKPKESGKREPIYTNKGLSQDEKELVFDAPRLRKLFVDYQSKTYSHDL